MKRHYIIQSYGADENYWLGRFVCLPLDAKSKDETVRVSFNYGASVEIYFHPDVLDYILVVDDADLIPPYELPEGLDESVPSSLGWLDTDT